MNPAQIIPFPGTEAAEPDVRVPGTDLDVSDLTRPLCQLNVFRLRERLWQPALSDAENTVLGHILDKTVGWQRHAETMTIASIARAVGKGRTQVKAAIASLKAKRAITATVCADNNEGLLIAPNLNWRPKMALAIPKRPRPTVNPGRISDHPPGRISDHNRDTPSSYTFSHTPASEPAARPILAVSKKSGRASGEAASPAPCTAGSSVHSGSAADFESGCKQPSLPLARINAAEQAVKARSTAAHDKARESTASDCLERTWRLAWAEKHADMPGAACPAWSVAEKGKVKNTLVALPLKPQELHDMLEWFVRDYDAVIGTHFRWLKTPAPALPTISFMAGMAKSVWGAWTRREQDTWLHNLPDDERREYYRLTREGRMTHEDAVAELTKRKVLRGEFEGLERAKAEAQRRQRIAEAAERQGPAFGPRGTHPASIAAMRQRQAPAASFSPEDADALLAGLKWQGGR